MLFLANLFAFNYINADDINNPTTNPKEPPMKKIIATFVFFIIISTGYASDHLVSIKNLSDKAKQEYRLIRQISNEYLLIIDDAQLSRIEKNRTPFTILDNTSGATCVYYLIGNSALQNSALEGFGTVLKKYDQFFLFKTDRKFIDQIKELKTRLEMLMVIPDQSSTATEIENMFVESTPNPLIIRMISQINIDTMRSYVSKLQLFPTRVCSSSENKTTVTQWLVSMLKPLCDSVYLETVGGTCGPNIIGIRNGTTNPSLTNYCVLGGHFDAVTINGPFKAAGADDNATGVAGVLECARVFRNYTFENTIKFVLFNGEEGGMLGSKVFTGNMKSKSHKIIGGAVTYDMLGHSTSASKNLIQIEGTDQDAANKAFITEYMQGIVDTYTKMKTYQYLKGFGSDHVPFWGNGYVGMLCIEREYEHPAYHKNFDTLDCPNGLNDMDLFKNIVKTGSAAIANLAKPIAEVSIADNNPCNTLPSSIALSQMLPGRVKISVPLLMNNPIDISIFSAQGKMVQSIQNVHAQSGVIVTPGSKGIYLIQITSGDLNQVRKAAIY
jgi:hypothetical protein